jgi:hypothetical protein
MVRICQIEQQNEHLSDQLASLQRMLADERVLTHRAAEALESERAEKNAALQAVLHLPACDTRASWGSVIKHRMPEGP